MPERHRHASLGRFAGARLFSCVGWICWSALQGPTVASAQTGTDALAPWGDSNVDPQSPDHPGEAPEDGETPDGGNLLSVDEVEPPRAPTVPRTACQGRRIRSIRVVGTQRVTDQDVLVSMELKPGVVCTDTALFNDARALWGLGFFNDLAFEGEPIGETHIDLLVRVTERPAIGRITYVGNDEFDENDFSEKLTIREGEVFSRHEVEGQVTKIRDLYAEEGFFLARVSYELREMPNNEVEVRFKIQEGAEVKIREIRFIGNKALSSDELLAFMQTSETGFWSFLSGGNTFEHQVFDEDLIRLQALYFDRGYLAVDIKPALVTLTPDRQYIDIAVPVDEGPRFRIGRVAIEEVDAQGQEVEPLGGRKALLEQVDAEPGKWFSFTKIQQSLQSVLRHYRDQGYAHVDIVPQRQLDMQARTADLIVSIRRGPLVFIERVNVRGNTKTRDRVIRRELKIAEGDLYNQTAIETSRAQVLRLGYFEQVNLTEEQGSSPSAIVLNVEVTEQSTGTFQVGAGFSSVESFILTAQIQEQNLFGNGHALALQLQLSGIRQLAQLRFVEPRLFGTPWTASAEVFKTIRQFQDFNRDSTGGSLSIGHPIFTDKLRLFAQYRAELVDITSRTGGFFSGGSGRGFNIFRRIPLFNLFRDGLTSSLRLSLTWDSRNHPIFPTSGVYASGSTEIADRFLGSQNVFIRHTAFTRFYQRLFGGVVFKTNLEWGLINSRQEQGVPVFERFFLGGIFNVRGFFLNSLGPRAGIPSTTDPNASVRDQGLVFGGNMQLFYNVELEFPIVEAVGIRGVVFTDGGNAWNLEKALCDAPEPVLGDRAFSQCGVDLTQLRTSWGFGFRWRSPLGPLRFEWGLPFNPRQFEQGLLFEFTIGNFF